MAVQCLPLGLLLTTGSTEALLFFRRKLAPPPKSSWAHPLPLQLSAGTVTGEESGWRLIWQGKQMELGWGLCEPAIKPRFPDAFNCLPLHWEGRERESAQSSSDKRGHPRLPSKGAAGCGQAGWTQERLLKKPLTGNHHFLQPSTSTLLSYWKPTLGKMFEKTREIE